MGRAGRRVIVIDPAANRLYELAQAFRQPDGSWRALSGAVFDLGSHRLRPEGRPSADGAGLPVFPGLVRYDETAAGEIRHTIRFTAPRIRKAKIWPARTPGTFAHDESFPPMGQRFRLKKNVRVNSFSPSVRVILTALQRYGLILADPGASWHLSGTPDPRWNNVALRELDRLTGRDFEAVDVRPLMDHSDSGRVRTIP
jgi:hypothetical protein